MTNTLEYETSQTRKKTQNRPETRFLLDTTQLTFFNLSDLICKMKFEFYTVAALALLADPVLGKGAGGLRRKTEVRVQFHHVFVVVFF
jgi:hypothetical protein